MKKLLSASLLFASTCFAEPMLGYDLLGLAHPKQDINMIANEIKPGTAIGVLERTFGPAIPALQKLIATGKVAAFRAHLRDGTCWRNHVCPPGTPSLNDLKDMAKLAKPFEQLTLATGVPCYLSPVLEHDEKDAKKVRAWFDTLKKVAPHCVPVQSPVSGAILPNILLEKHGTPAKGDIISGDGNSSFDMDLPNWYPRAKKIAFLWWGRCNLRPNADFIPPKLRSSPILRGEMQQATLLMSPPTPMPSFAACPNARPLSPPEIWKTRSEDSANGTDPRQNKPVLIIKGKAPRLEVYSSSGASVDCLKYYSNYIPIPGTSRYYMGSCSGHDPVQMMHALGQEWGCIKGADRQIAVSAIRRSGTFR